MNILNKENHPGNNSIDTNLENQKSTILTIEQSLKSMQQRIQHLLKQQQKNRKKISNAFQNSLQIIENKINHTQSESHLRNINKKKEQQVTGLQTKIKVWREKKQQLMSMVKETIGQLKKQEHKNIKELSRKNQLIIEQNKKKTYEKKKFLYSKLKQQKEHSKLHAQKYLEQKKQELQQLKEAQKKYAMLKKKKMMDQLKQLQKTQFELLQKINHTSQVAKNLESVSKLTNRLGSQQFQQIIIEVKKSNDHIENKNEFKQKILERILKEKNNISNQPSQIHITPHS